MIQFKNALEARLWYDTYLLRLADGGSSEQVADWAVAALRKRVADGAKGQRIANDAAKTLGVRS